MASPNFSKNMENLNTPATANPLSKYFRQPAIYMDLPSRGKYWPDGTLDLPVTGKLAVYPMTTRDEITLRTPDALMNGTSVVDVIQSCCPSITNAWRMPSVDVDAVLIGIRIASYGNEMDFDTRCPYCKAENKHGLNLSTVLDNIVCPDYSEKVSYQDLQIKLYPQEYFSVNRAGTLDFEEQQLLQALEKTNITDGERSQQVADSVNRLISAGLDTITGGTEYIVINQQNRVTEKEHIKEFYSNAPSTVTKLVQSRLSELATLGGIQPPSVACSECAKTYEAPVEFDFANFFGNGS